MRALYLALGTAACTLTATPALAQTGDSFSLSASTGVDYSTGGYGSDAGDTDILVVPLALRATSGNLALTASVPYIRIDGPGGVVVGPGGEQIPGVPTESGVREGIGDLSLGAAYTFGGEAGGPQFTASGRVKLPTSDESDQLTTGETDYTVKGEVSYPLGDIIPFASVGYRIPGDPEGFGLESGPTASAGFSTVLGRSVLIASYDYASALSELSEDSHSIFGGLSVPVGERLNLTGYGVAGLNEGAPDFGVGLLATMARAISRLVR